MSRVRQIASSRMGVLADPIAEPDLGLGSPWRGIDPVTIGVLQQIVQAQVGLLR
jgi:hypothetical protein